MSVTVEDLAGYLNLPAGHEDDLSRVLGTALTMIDRHVTGDVGVWTPGQVSAYDTATLRAAAELWRWQHSGPAGDVGYPDGSDFPSPVYRDVFYTVQPLLAHAGIVAPVVFA